VPLARLPALLVPSVLLLPALVPLLALPPLWLPAVPLALPLAVEREALALA